MLTSLKIFGVAAVIAIGLFVVIQSGALQNDQKIVESDRNSVVNILLHRQKIIKKMV